jgi:hypothetical protein
MNRYKIMNRILSFRDIICFLLLIAFYGCRSSNSTSTGTVISIDGDKWFLNERIINEGSPAEGLLMNVRMINCVFEDRGSMMPEEFRKFDPEINTDSFISKIPEYMNSGVNAFTIGLQGGNPGYEGAINSAFDSAGSLRQEYLDRVEKVIRDVDENSGAVILSCFYQRQHSHYAALNGREDIRNAVRNTVEWIKVKGFRNVVLEISNEYWHNGYANWMEGRWLMSTSGQLELVKYAKSLYPELLVSTSGLGDGRMNDSLAAAVDFITIHFNSTPLKDYSDRIQMLKSHDKPVICNEDDKTGLEGAEALRLSVSNGCGWGYMNNRQNQYIPFTFEGVMDDTTVYKAFGGAVLPLAGY